MKGKVFNTINVKVSTYKAEKSCRNLPQTCTNLLLSLRMMLTSLNLYHFSQEMKHAGRTPFQLAYTLILGLKKYS